MTDEWWLIWLSVTLALPTCKGALTVSMGPLVSHGRSSLSTHQTGYFTRVVGGFIHRHWSAGCCSWSWWGLLCFFFVFFSTFLRSSFTNCLDALMMSSLSLSACVYKNAIFMVLLILLVIHHIDIVGNVDKVNSGAPEKVQWMRSPYMLHAYHACALLLSLPHKHMHVLTSMDLNPFSHRWRWLSLPDLAETLYSLDN